MKNYWRKKVCGIYRISDKVSGKSYIGKSVDVIGRWSGHGGIQNSDVSRAFWERPTDFCFEVLETCKEDQLGEREDFWILLYADAAHGVFNKQLPRGKRKKAAQDSIASYCGPLLESLSALKTDKQYVAMADDSTPTAGPPAPSLEELEKLLQML